MSDVNVDEMTPAQLSKLLEATKEALEEKQSEEKEKVKQDIYKLVEKKGFTVTDIFGEFKTPRAKLKPLYRNPNNHEETWSGRGMRPRWLAAAMEEGKELEDFKI